VTCWLVESICQMCTGTSEEWASSATGVGLVAPDMFTRERLRWLSGALGGPGQIGSPLQLQFQQRHIQFGD
jgi:hypothetical protein